MVTTTGGVFELRVLKQDDPLNLIWIMPAKGSEAIFFNKICCISRGMECGFFYTYPFFNPAWA